MSGSVSPLYAPANILGQAGVVFGHDLTSEAALTKLSYLLALPDLTVQDVTRQMSESIRGELTEQSETLFEHPKGAPPSSPRLASLTGLGSAIGQGDLQAVREVMRAEPEWLLNEADPEGNTPLVSLLISMLGWEDERRRSALIDRLPGTGHGGRMEMRRAPV